MASKDIINSVDVNNPSKTRRAVDLLPSYHRTDRNTKFLASTLDQFIQQPEIKRIDGYVGSKLSLNYDPSKDQYIDGTTKLRNDYQLEPSLIIQDVNQNIKASLGYDDLINQLAFNNAKTDNLDRLFRPQSYSYDPMIDWDKFINFRQYYWLPTGPDVIEISGKQKDTVSTYTVVDSNDQSSLIFTPDGGTTNPLLTLYRGLTYVFNVTSAYPFYVKTAYVEGVDSLYSGTTNNGIKVGQVIVTIDEFTPNTLFYFAEGSSTAVGKFVVKTIEENTVLDIEKDILGKQSYISENRVKFTNGMKVRFIGSVTPEEYADKDFIIEGVGNKITLVDYAKLQPVGLETTNLDVNFDSNPFDEFPFDDFRYVPLTPDYITINKAAIDKNPWSNYNRWVHQDVITETAKANGVQPIYPADNRAQRPIIEFIAGLQLYNYGSVGKDNIDLIDTITVDAFKNVEGSFGYYVDGVPLAAGNRVIFNADTDPLVRGRIYEVKISIIDNKQYINLEEVLDSQPLFGESLIVKSGNQYKGKAWWFNGDTWQVAQQKTGVNQPPLWELYDADGNRYSDQTFYNSSFEGTKLFGYAVGTVSDTVLGFNVAFRNINNVGEYLFNNYFATDTFTNFFNGEIFVLNVFDGYLKFNTHSTSVFRTVWTKTVDKPIPILQFQVLTQDSVFVEITSIDNPGYTRDLDIEVFVNDIKQIKNTNFVISKDEERAYIVSTSSFNAGDRVLLKLYTSKTPNANGYYEPPANLTNNPLNGSVNDFTFTQLSDHVKTIVDFNGEFTGSFPGSSNLRDLGNISQYASRIVSHDNPLSFAHFFLGTRENNLIDAVRKVSTDYNQFKSNLLRNITELRGTYSPAQSLDIALVKLNSTRDNTFSYKNSDMLAYGNDQKTRIFKVTNARNVKYSLASTYNDEILSERAILVYLGSYNTTTQQTDTRLLVKGYDYVVNKFDASITITTPLVKGDILTVLDYPSTVGSYVPPTPTKLGLYPKFKPEIFVDDTYASGPRRVIQGHDGSLTVAFTDIEDFENGRIDYRDAVLLEYETRVYNNLTVDYNPDLLDINTVLSGAFRSDGYSQSDITDLISADFLKWAGFFGVDYQTNSTLDELDSFTFNYTGSIDTIAKRPLIGFWRGVYKHFYDTDRPHSHPWEMLGFSEKPSWWEAQYGPAPYTSGNLILWQDLEMGRIAVSPTGPIINSAYARPGLSKIIPVDGHGNLLSPADSGLASTPIVNLADPNRIIMLRSDQVAVNWKAGDHAPAETAWRRSSFWPYACQVLLALAKPATYAALMFDTSRIKKNVSGEYRYGDNEIFLNPSKVLLFNDQVNGSRVLASGYSVFVIETGTAKDTQYLSTLKQDLTNLDYRLMVKLGGFANKDKLQAGIDAVDPSSPYPGVLIPAEDYKLFFSSSSPIESLGISGLIIQKTNKGWSVRGYDKYKPYFTVLKPFASNIDQVERVGGVSENFVNWTANTTYNSGQIIFYNDRYYRVIQRHNSDVAFNSIYYQSLPFLPTKGGVAVQRRTAFDTVETIVRYGIEYTNIQEVYDLIVGYGVWLESKGFVFEEFNNDLGQILDWKFTAKEFLYWTTQNWSVNSVITLSPFANKVTFRSDNGVVDSIVNNFYEYSLLKADGAPFPKERFTIVRLDGEFVLSTMNTQEGIFFAKLNLVQKEHVLVMNNFTLFNDVVYDVETGYRQRRLKIKGFVTRDWNGDFFSPGFVFDQANIVDWTKFTDYGIGDVVRFSSKYYAAIKSVPGAEVFDITQWAVLNEKPEAELLPNFEYKINQFEDFYSLDIDNFDVGQQAMAQHLIGYTPRPYLNFIIGDPIAQYKFYQGFIRDKGSRNSLDVLSKSSLNSFRSTLDFNEEWAFRVGYYGGYTTYQELETALEFTKFVENPQIIEFVRDKPLGESSTIYYKNQDDVVIKPENFDIDSVFKTKKITLDDNEFQLPIAGYVRFDDVTATAYNNNSILDIANNSSLIAGSTIWLGFRQDGEWDVLRVTDVPTVVTGIAINIPGQSITISTFYAHQLSVGELISVTGVAAEIDQCYQVIEILNNNQFVVLSTLTILPELPSTITGLIFVFKSSRLSTFDDLSAIPFLDRWAINEKVWVDNDGEDNWAVYQKIDNYTAQLYNSALELADQYYGSKIVTRQNSDLIIVSAPNAQQLVGIQNRWGKIYVLFKDAFNEVSLVENYALNDESTYYSSTSNTATNFGYSLAYDPKTNLVIGGAPLTSRVKARSTGTNIVNPDLAFNSTIEQGVVKLSLLNSVTARLVDTAAFPDASLVITTTATTTSSQFGWSVALSTATVISTTTNTLTLLVGAPAEDTRKGQVYRFTVSVNTTTSGISITPGTTLLRSTLNVGSEFGSEITGNTLLTRVAVSAPGFLSNTSTGAVFVYNFATTSTSTMLTGDMLGENSLSESDLFATKIKMSADGEILAVASPLAFDRQLGIRSGVVDIFAWNTATTQFVYSQRIGAPISALTNTTKFGWDIAFNDVADTLVITSIGSAKTPKQTFDKFTQRYTTSSIATIFGSTSSIFVNNPESLERNRITTFDGGSTQFSTKNSNAGTAHVYNRLGVGSTKWAFSQSLNSNNIQAGSTFGYAVDVTNNSVTVGAPALPLENTAGFNDANGQIFVFDKIDQTSNSWKLLRRQEPIVDLASVKRAVTIDSNEEQVKDYIDIIDPIKGNILGIASEELRYITPYDPAIYSLGLDGVNIDPNTNWLDEHVGELWWDLSTVKYVWYEQGELEYRKNNWNNIFPGSSIDVYEWVRSPYLPAEWSQLADTADGLTRDISGQPKFNDNTVISVKQVYNSVSNSFDNVYYFWVKNKSTVPPSVKNRARPAFEIAQNIADPVISGSQFLAILSPTALMLANAKSSVSSEQISLNISFDTGIDSANRHTEWLLLQENDPNSRPNGLLEKKLIDSLLGRDSLGNTVPDPLLPNKLKYGIEIRPRQSLFVNRLEALRNIIEFTNDTIRTELLTGVIDFTKLNSIEPIPAPETYDSIVEDIFTLELISTNTFITAKIYAIVNSDGEIVDVLFTGTDPSGRRLTPGFGYVTPPTITINNSGTGAEFSVSINEFGSISEISIINPGKNYTSNIELVVRPYTVVVQTDSNSTGKWAIYEWNDLGKLWIKTRTQSYNTQAYWKYIDWTSSTYDPLQTIVTTVPSPYVLEVLQTLAVGSYVKVQNGGDGRYLILRKTNGSGGTFEPDWDIVYSEKGTIQFLDAVWNIKDTLYAWDKSVGWDQTQYDQAPDKEIEFILTAIHDDIFINNLKGNWNKLFFKAVRYALSEQKFLDWAFKTTFISVINNSGSLDQPATYKLENVRYYEEFLNEVKPYHTKIRRFTQQYTGTELTNTFNTDFDLPAYYNTATLNFNKVEFGNSLLLQYPWKSWYDNYAYTVETIELYSSGDGYTQVPSVTIVTAPGDSGFGATAVAFIALGKVTRIIVTNPGQGYTTTPTVIISGGGTPGTSYAVWEPNKNYFANQIILHLGYYYRVTADITTGDVFDSQLFERLLKPPVEDGKLTPAQAYARLGSSPVRSNMIQMRFDRVSAQREIGPAEFTDEFTSDGSDVTYELTWVPVADKNKIELTINGILQLIDAYDILYSEAKFNPQENTEYTKKYATLSLRFVPAAGDAIRITYTKSLDLYTAADRIQDYYSPQPGMPGNDLAQLMTGVEYSGLIVDGLPFNFSGGWSQDDQLGWASTAWDNFGLEEGYTSYSVTTASTTQTFAIPTLISTGTEVNVYIRSENDRSISGKRIDNVNFDNFKGTWSNLVSYSTGSVVFFNDDYYQAVRSVSSSTVKIIPTSSSSWITTQYDNHVFMITLVGKGTGAVDDIQILVPGVGYNAAFTTLSIAAPNTLTGANSTGTLVFTAVKATVVNTGTGYSVGDILTVPTPYGTSTFAVTRTTPGTGVIAVNIVDGGEFISTTPTTPLLTTSLSTTSNTATLSLTYGIKKIAIGNPGSGYTEPPVITIVETINTGNAVSQVSVPAFARSVLRSEFREINSSTTISHVTIPAVAFTTTSSLVILRYSNSDGTVTPTDQDSLDAVVDGGNLSLTTARGISPSEIILDGGGQATRHITGMMDDGFLNPINSYAPEECVPGQVQESIGISVYTQPATNSPVISTKHYWYDGSQLTYALGVKPTSIDSVVVVYNKVKLSQPNDKQFHYTIDFDKNTITFVSGRLTGSGWISITSMQPGSISLLDSLVGISTVSNTVLTSSAKFTDIGSEFVTINGQSVTASSSTYQLSSFRGRTRLTAYQTGTIQAYFFSGVEKSFSEIFEQSQEIDIVSTSSVALLQSPGVAAPFHSQVIVTKNGSRLRPPVTSYYQAANGQRSFPVSETKTYPNIDIGTLEVYVNGNRVPINSVWDLDTTLNQVIFSAGFLKDNDVIAIVVKRDYDYLIENNRLVLVTPLVFQDRYTVTTFTNHNPDFIRTDRFDANASGQYTMQRPVLDSSYVWVTYNGKALVANVDYAVETNNRTVILRDGLYNNTEYQNSTVSPVYQLNNIIAIDSTTATNYVSGDWVEFGGPGWATPAVVEISVNTATNTVGIIRVRTPGLFTGTTLPTGPQTPTRVIQEFNTVPPRPFGTGLRLTLNFKDVTNYPTDTVLITSFADIAPLVGYRIFHDMLGRTHYKRLSARNTTVLTQNLLLTDTIIVVEDPTVLSQPNPRYNRPGVVLIDGERIEFFTISGNTLGQLRRSTLGTGVKEIHYAGTEVVDQGSDQTVPFKEEVQKFTTSTNSTSTFTVELSNITFTTSTNYSDQIEVKYAGRSLLKPNLSTFKHDFTVAYDSNEYNSDTIVNNQFAIDNGSTELIIYPDRIDGYVAGGRLEVVRRISRIWYDSVDSNTTLSKNNTIQAKFLTDKPAVLPPYLSSSTYVAADLTLYLETLEALQTEDGSPIEGI
jgi:hypothetical protein